MTPDEVKAIYDARYATTYEETFLTAPLHIQDTEDEIGFLRGLLRPGSRWLDVACGTGYFLRQFPNAERVGLDLSPAMLDAARHANRDVTFREHDFRNEIPEFIDCFDVVSCMWYAYGMVDNVRELLQVVANIASWTSHNGCCFVPVADPFVVMGQGIPYRVDPPRHPAGDITVTGILWSFNQDNGDKVHHHQIAPNTAFLIEQFAAFFEKVEIVTYRSGRPALIARSKRRR